MTSRWLMVACVLVASFFVLALGTAAASVRAPAPGASQGSLGFGDSLFWQGEGEFVGRSTIGTNVPYGFTNNFGQPGETCADANPDTCWAYKFDVAETSDTTTLRVAIDANRRGDCFQVEAWAPGTYDDPLKRPASTLLQCPEIVEDAFQQWNMEAHLLKPAPGTWTLRVVPFLVTDWDFRLRVSLQQEVAATGELVPPNLQAYPPYEFGFVAPESPDAGSEIDKQNPPGPPGISCTESEQAEAVENEESPPQRCLRFSTGMYNVGDGPLDLLLNKPDPEPDPEPDPDHTPRGSVTQRVHRDTCPSPPPQCTGETRTELIAEERAAGEEHAAGEWTFHEAHDHDHYAGFVDFELYWVSNVNGPQLDPKSTKRLDPPVSGHKSGWNPADQRMAHWNRFDQAPSNAHLFACRAQIAEAPQVDKPRGCITQGQGWADHYRWQRPGNYVEFPTHADGSNVGGDYVVRMVVDRDDRVVESSGRDNSAYAWIRVSGEDVAICERGLGDSPWDPQKRIHAPSFWLPTPGTTADSATGGCS